MSKRQEEDKLVSNGDWSRWAMEKYNFLWTVDIRHKPQREVVLKSHRIGGICPLCSKSVLDGSECESLDDKDILEDYQQGRLTQIVNESTKVPRD